MTGQSEGEGEFTIPQSGVMRADIADDSGGVFRLTIQNTGTVALDNAGFFCGDLLDSTAENRRVVEPDSRINSVCPANALSGT